MTIPSRDEGVVKYHAIHQNCELPPYKLLAQLDCIRTKLFDLNLVGVYPDGIGFGNVSIRYANGCIISGTATGSIRTLGGNGYCYVHSFDLEKNAVCTKGLVNASSESMTHCAIYQANSTLQCVLHIHNRKLWKQLIKQGHDSTPSDVPYGTPQMAISMRDLISINPKPSGLLVMTGHDDGIIAYGSTISLAFNQIQEILTH